MPLALSTAWNSFRYEDGKKLILEIKGLGINEVELSFNLTHKIVEDIYQLVRQEEIKVNSVHNFCPIPEGLPREIALPDCYSLSSLDEVERERALRYSKLTIETASRLKAQAVILHCGRVEGQDLTKELISYYKEGHIQSPQARQLKVLMRSRREEKANPHIARVLKNLEELCAYGGKLGIKLGIENRFYYQEIPSIDELGIILEYFKGSNIFYWHDTGHAQLWENLGMVTHWDYLERYFKYLLGVHLHDIEGTEDHLAPLKGKFDFSLLRPYMTPLVLKTIEAHHPAAAEDIIRSRDFLEGLYGKD